MRNIIDKEEGWQKGFGGVFDKIIKMGGESDSEKRSNFAQLILEGMGVKPNQGGGIVGGYGLQEQSFKDAPKTSIITDDKGRPSLGYKAMRGGKLVYLRGPQPGTGTKNPLEMLGRSINPGAYKQNDAKLARQRHKEAMVNALQGFQAQNMAPDAQARMMKQMGGNLTDVQNDLNYRKTGRRKAEEQKLGGGSVKLYNKPKPNTGTPYKSRFARPRNAGVGAPKPPGPRKPRVIVANANSRRANSGRPAHTNTPKAPGHSSAHRRSSGRTVSGSAYGIGVS